MHRAKAETAHRRPLLSLALALFCIQAAGRVSADDIAATAHAAGPDIELARPTVPPAPVTDGTSLDGLDRPVVTLPAPPEPAPLDLAGIGVPAEASPAWVAAILHDESFAREDDVTVAQNAGEAPAESSAILPIDHLIPLPVDAAQTVLPEFPAQEPNIAAARDLDPSATASLARPSPPTAAAAAAVDAVPALPELSETATDAIRTAVGRALRSTLLTTAERQAIAGFYAADGFRPVWTRHEGWTPAALRVLDRLGRADEDGLDPTRYLVPPVAHDPRPDWTILAAADVRLTQAALLYAREASAGRIAPHRVDALLTVKPPVPNADEVLLTLRSARDPGNALAAFNPPHDGYRKLRAKLADVRRNAGAPAPEPGSVTIAEGPVLRIGTRDPRVPALRTALGLPATDDVYDRVLAAEVARFQKQAGLRANGMFDGRARLALAGQRTDGLEGELVANMERWRWLPRELGPRYIAVNVPAYALEFVKDGEVLHTARVIVGAVKTQTPVFSDQIDHVVVNPSWGIPPGILKRNPKYLDPAYAQANGYEITRRGKSVSVRQPPGARNALGYIKFIFPNDHAVYLHDTPQRALFARSDRALSNGCVRVEDPFRLAEAIFGGQNGWTGRRLASLVGHGERQIKLSEKLPIHLVYFTLTVDEGGELAAHPDIYGHSRALRRLLGLPG